MKKFTGTLFLLVFGTVQGVHSEEETYAIDPTHTFPTFEADHMGGLSLWRGKINRTSGKVIVDFETKTGSVDIAMDMSSIDFGLVEMNDHAKSDDIFDVERFPSATYIGNLIFEGDEPVGVSGELNLHGVTKPVDLKVNRFKCMLHPMKLAQVCGADAETTIRRDDFGVDFAKAFGFDMGVLIRIGIEAIAVD